MRASPRKRPAAHKATGPSNAITAAIIRRNKPRYSKAQLAAAALHDAPLQTLQTRTVARRCSVSEDHAKAVAQLAFGERE